MKKIISLVVPCYNEEESLAYFVQACQEVQKALVDYHLEILFVNDGSTDQTLALMRHLAQQESDWIHYLSFSRNFGKEAAMLAGLEHSRGDYVAVMDADLQDPPELLIEMISYLESGDYDVVATRREDRQGEPPIRSFFANLFYKFNNKISDVQLEEGARDYRLMSRQVVDSIISLQEHNRFSKGIFVWVGYRVKYLAYENIERVAGQTSWSFRKLMSYAFEGIISFSDVPLKLASWLGMLTFLFALIYGGVIIGKTLIFGATTPGWPSLAVLIVGMGGLQLLCLGIVGRYIGKIYLESKNRPHYILQEMKLPKDE